MHLTFFKCNFVARGNETLHLSEKRTGLLASDWSICELRLRPRCSASQA